MIELCHVTAGYPGRPVLEDVNLTFQAGKITALIGPNGCGKTTLLRAACGLLPLTGGQVLYGGKDLRRFGRKEFARLVSILPQTRDVPSIRAEQLVAHGRYPHLSFGRDLTQADREKIAWAMEVTGTTALKDKELSQLSGGERQRVYLAMTLSQDTDILFLDEPTTYLDMAHQLEVLELLQTLNRDQGKTIALVIHELNLAARFSDWMIALKSGAIRGAGTPAEVMTPALLREVFGLDALIAPDPWTGRPSLVSYRLAGEE